MTAAAIARVLRPGVVMAITGHLPIAPKGAPLKPGVLGRKRHELDSPNLGGHLPHHPTFCYYHPVKHTEMSCGWS
ncbi:hypothetical protein AVEN_200881-1 [Araneus ventricosus]|uniref:Uncharacterized protein n=1 Tax=Araneus ventricosus TaxID=182803 RepID=A0A4Y2DP79_ARAVE|nr:hypothetical protein AVEN_200881-1 [Araneus ventricosus]